MEHEMLLAYSVAKVWHGKWRPTYRGYHIFMERSCGEHIDKGALASVLQADQGELHLLVEEQAACMRFEVVSTAILLGHDNYLLLRRIS